jgi:hypothetical protein
MHNHRRYHSRARVVITDVLLMKMIHCGVHISNSSGKLLPDAQLSIAPTAAAERSSTQLCLQRSGSGQASITKLSFVTQLPSFDGRLDPTVSSQFTAVLNSKPLDGT